MSTSSSWIASSSSAREQSPPRSHGTISRGSDSWPRSSARGGEPMSSQVAFDAISGALRARTFTFALALAALLLLGNLIVDSSFVAPGSLAATLAALAPFAIVAMATAPSVIAGGLDLSAGPVLGLANVMLVAVLLPAGVRDPWGPLPLLLAL